MGDEFFAQLLAYGDEEIRTLLEGLATAAEASHARSTLDQYRYYWGRWQAWANEHGHAALPADPRAVALYTVHLSRTGGRTRDADGNPTGLRPATIANHLLALRLTHLDLGHADPTAHPALRRVLKGIRRLKGTRAEKREPMTYEPLMRTLLAMDVHHDLRRATQLVLLAADTTPLAELAGREGDPPALTATQLLRLDLGDTDITDAGLAMTLPVRKREVDIFVHRAGGPTCFVAAVEHLRDTVNELLGYADAGGIVGETAAGLRATWRRDSGRLVGQLLPRFDRRGRIVAGRPTRAALVGHLCDLGYAVGACKSRRTLPRWRPETVDAALVAANRRPLTDLRDRAMLLIGWHTAARRSNLTWLRVGEVTEVTATDDHPGGLEVLFRRSKTDPEQQGVELVVPATGDRFCPAAAWRAWQDAAAAAYGQPLPAEYPAFPPTSGTEALGDPTERFRLAADGTIKTDRSDRPISLGLEGITGGQINRIVQARTEAAGLASDPNGKLINWGGHSLRRGWLTEAARQGMSLAEMQAVSQHKQVDTLMGYIAAAKKWDKTASAPLKMSYEALRAHP